MFLLMPKFNQYVLFQYRACSEQLMPVTLNCCYIATLTDIELELVKDWQINFTCELSLSLLHKLSYNKSGERLGKNKFVSFTCLGSGLKINRLPAYNTPPPPKEKGRGFLPFFLLINIKQVEILGKTFWKKTLPGIKCVFITMNLNSNCWAVSQQIAEK